MKKLYKNPSCEVTEVAMAIAVLNASPGETSGGAKTDPLQNNAPARKPF